MDLPRMPPKTCMYCLLTEPARTFVGKDHVMPEAFGKFRESGGFRITLEDVCDQCNNTFGGGIERALAHDSIEAFNRLRYGVRPIGSYNPARHLRSLSLTIASGASAGAAAKLLPDTEQQRFRFEMGECSGVSEPEEGPYQFYSPADLPPASSFTERGVTELFFKLRMDDEAAVRLMHEKGYDSAGMTTVAENVNEQDVAANLDFKITSDHLRALAKIGFNYLASRCGAAYARLPIFDEVRAYILDGQRGPERLVLADSEPRPATSESSPFRYKGHVVTIAWSIQQRVLVAQVVLQNGIRYSVRLTNRLCAPPTARPFGHFFDYINHTVTPLQLGGRPMAAAS